MSTGDGDVLDLTELLAARALEPRRATFAGLDLTIRRDLSAAEVVEFFSLIHAGRQVEALGMLVGDDDARALATKIDALPMEHQRPIYQRIMREAGALPRHGGTADQAAEQEPLGESSAS